MKGDWAAASRPTLQDNISDDQNMEAWLRMMKTILTEEGLGHVVRFGVPPDPSKIPELAEELRKWRELAKEDMKALQILLSALPNSLSRRLLSVASAKNLWDFLNEVTVHVAECVGDFTFEENIWMISSTNSNHMTPYEKFFTTLDKSRNAKVGFTSGYSVTGQGIGDVTIMTKEGEKTIENVLYVPGIKGNVLSVSQLERSGFEVTMDRETCTLWDRTTGKNLGETVWEERGFCLRFDVIKNKKRQVS